MNNFQIYIYDGRRRFVLEAAPACDRSDEQMPAGMMVHIRSTRRYGKYTHVNPGWDMSKRL